jgi:DNA-binding MarR family transcriptional regulator
LRLTEAGDARASALVAAARAQESRAVGCLSAAERRSLAGLLARLIAANP